MDNKTNTTYCRVVGSQHTEFVGEALGVNPTVTHRAIRAADHEFRSIVCLLTDAVSWLSFRVRFFRVSAASFCRSTAAAATSLLAATRRGGGGCSGSGCGSGCGSGSFSFSSCFNLGLRACFCLCFELRLGCGCLLLPRFDFSLCGRACCCCFRCGCGFRCRFPFPPALPPPFPTRGVSPRRRERGGGGGDVAGLTALRRPPTKKVKLGKVCA